METELWKGTSSCSGWRTSCRTSSSPTESHTLQQGNNHPGSEQVWRLGHSSTHFTHTQGPFVVHNGNDATDMATCQSWLRNKYDGTAVAAESENGIAEDAAFFVELDIATS